ncbi:unnamed protein product [Brassicogethes aeneus]|uniref:Peroxisomal membrane protein PEX16 n=1 Tax=Brassicogethes aeneus TaxID=1431903 RepID=A0A9P0BCZ9_BRAAE|nr:unnamed protein product [Brassicogethes aeneus]
MSSILFSLPDLFNSYKAWVVKNPQHLNDYEITAKWLSYFIAGRINNSHVVSELVYCLSNLLVFFNDSILNKAKHINLPSSGDTIKVWLTIVEYSEVFFELSAMKLWGKAGKWLVIVAVQVFKCISRLILVYYHKEAIIQTPPISQLDRKNLHRTKPVNDVMQFENSTFTLKHSGRVVRKVENSPPISTRDWKPLQAEVVDEAEDLVLKRKKIIAETIYIAKPLVHLASMGTFGSRAWKPWLISLAMDMTSWQLYNSCKKSKLNSLSNEQKLQISKRTVALLLYLLRSPFYDSYSKDKINSFLMAMSNNLPLVGMVCNPLREYLPFWQSSYFYMWST